MRQSSHASGMLMVCQTCLLPHGVWIRLALSQNLAKEYDVCLHTNECM